MLDALLGDRFAVAAAAPVLVDDALFAVERRHVAQAVAKRRAEFGTVRVCARRALAELGIAPCPLVPAPDGSPQWPAGIVGSLSHTDELCAAAVTGNAGVRAVGIDVERDAVLDMELEEMVCTAAERDWIRRQDPDWHGRLGTLFFSAKEAFYKCQHALTKATLDFADVELEVSWREGEFRVARLAAAFAPVFRSAAFSGRFGYAAGHITTVAVLER